MTILSSCFFIPLNNPLKFVSKFYVKTKFFFCLITLMIKTLSRWNSNWIKILLFFLFLFHIYIYIYTHIIYDLSISIQYRICYYNLKCILQVTYLRIYSYSELFFLMFHLERVTVNSKLVLSKTDYTLGIYVGITRNIFSFETIWCVN